MNNKPPYPEWVARAWPQGKTVERRRIEKCSDQTLWYATKVGHIIDVHYFVTFGAFDTQGRFLWYYDLSAPI